MLVSHIGRKFDDNSVKATLIFRDFFFLGKLPPWSDLDFMLTKMETEPGIPTNTNPIKIFHLLDFFGNRRMTKYTYNKKESELYRKNKNLLNRCNVLNDLPMKLEDLFDNIVDKLKAFHVQAQKVISTHPTEAHTQIPIRGTLHIPFSAPERFVILIDPAFLQP